MNDYKVIQVSYKADPHDAIFIVQFFCTVMKNQRDNLRISDFERNCVQLIASREQTYSRFTMGDSFNGTLN